MIDHGVDAAAAATARATTPRTSRALRADLEADRDHAARRPELHRRRQPRRSGRSGRSASAFDPYEGLVLHQIAYDDDGRVRSVLHRASISEMVVPTATRASVHGWKNAFDAGEWGLGRMTQPLTLGCDCLGEIHYFDATLANEQGEPWVIENAICMHEEDYGILWKHVDLFGGTQRGAPQPAARRELRRDRRQLRVRLLLVLLPRRQHPARGEAHRHRVADGDRAGHAARVRQRRSRRASPRRTTSTCSTPASTSTSTAPSTRCTRSRPSRCRPGPDNPWGNAFRQRGDAARHRGRRAARHRRRRRRACWKIVNPRRAQRARAAGRRTSSCRRCRRRRCWRSPTRRSGSGPGSRSTTCGSRRTRATSGAPRASTRTSTRAATGCRAWTAADRSIVDTDVVLWYTFGVTHFVRPEDWPVMPVEYTRVPAHAGRLLRPQPRARRPPGALPTTARTDEDDDSWAMDPRRTAARARQLHRDRGGGGPHRRLAVRGPTLFTEDAEYVEHHYGTFHGRDAIHGVDHRDDGAVAELGDEGVPARLVRVRRRTRLVDLPDREPVPRSRRRQGLRGLQPDRA